jgi:predicted DNA-binding transcriptional regulator YafY
MADTPARLLRLLSLLQARGEWQGGELAERLEVDVRTVRRDVERLRRLGYPVRGTRGATGGYRLGAGAALPPLLLDDDEAVAVALGLRTAAGGTVADIEETSVRALAKLEQVLPAHLRRRVAALTAATVPMAGGGPTVDPGLLTTVATACRDATRLRFSYRARDGDGAAPREVEPYRLAHTGRRWYLLAYDLDRGAWRTFRVDRIAARPAPEPGSRFAPRPLPDDDVAAYVSRSISSSVYRYQARVLLHGPAEAVAAVVPPAAGLVEAVDAATCVLHVGGPVLEVMPVYIAQLGFEFEVLGPPELVEQVRRLAGLFGRAAEAAATTTATAAPPTTVRGPGGA